MEVSVILERCVGCAICELLCSLKHEGVFNPRKSRIRLSMKGVPESFEVAVCRQCADPACLRAFESGALSKDIPPEGLEHLSSI